MGNLSDFISRHTERPVQYVIGAHELKEIILEIFDEREKKIKAQTTPPEEFFEPDEVAKRFHISKTTLWKWGKRGVLHPRKLGRKVLYAKSELENALNVQA